MPTPAGDGETRTALHFPGTDWRSAATIIVAILIGFFTSVQPRLPLLWESQQTQVDVGAIPSMTDVDMDSLLESLKDLGLDSGVGVALWWGQLGVKDASEALRVFQQGGRRSLRERRSICPSQDMPKTEDFGKPVEDTHA